MKIIGLPIAFLHELAHFVAAWCLGYHPVLHRDRVMWEQPRNRSSGIVVLLAPLVPGIALAVWPLLVWLKTGHVVWIIVVVLHLLLWNFASASDYFEAWFLLRNGRRPSMAERPRIFK